MKEVSFYEYVSDKKINLNNRFNLFIFDKTKKVGLELRKDIIVDIQSLKKLLKEKKIF